MSTNKKISTADAIIPLAKPIADSLGLELWDVRFEKEGALWYLRVFIDKEGGVDIDDCEAMTRPLNKLLDETDPIEQSYVFEVGSPGLGRDLKKPEHFEKYKGKEIRVGLYRAIDGVKELIGTLVSHNKQELEIECNGETKTIPMSSCSFVKAYDDGDLFD